MNLRGAKELIYNGNKHSRAYFNYRLVWQKLKPGAFAKDFKYLESSEKFEGIWYREKGALVVYGGTGSDYGIGSVFTEKFIGQMPYWLVELDSTTFKFGDWIDNFNAKENTIYLEVDSLNGLKNYYLKKNGQWYIIEKMLFYDFKKRISEKG